eukprot:CCRYP_009167-RA/>CCRYP_009167-RA protein AED:0.38 eAED:0.69 QI:0/0/0/1/1/1/2/0/136
MTKAKGADQKQKMESMDSRIPKKPKKVGWTDKHCMRCKKHGGPHKSHNTHDCRRYNKDGTPIKKNGVQTHSKERKPEGVNFAQIVGAELKKALRKKSSKRKKHAPTTRKVTAIPMKASEDAGRIALGNYIHVRNVN